MPVCSSGHAHGRGRSSLDHRARQTGDLDAVELVKLILERGETRTHASGRQPFSDITTVGDGPLTDGATRPDAGGRNLQDVAVMQLLLDRGANCEPDDQEPSPTPADVRRWPPAAGAAGPIRTPSKPMALRLK